MVVVTLESTTTTALGHEGPKSPPHPIKEQCVVTKSLLHNHRHRRTLSPDKILFLKVPELVPPPVVTTDIGPTKKVLAAILRPSDSEAEDPSPSLKRVAPEGRDKEEADDRNDGRPMKKARLIAVAVRRTVHFELQNSDAKHHDQTADIITHVRIFDRVEACDVADVWWSGAEMLEIQAREKSTISVMNFTCDHYSDQVLNLVKQARDESCMPGMANLESASPLWVANSPARGLEKDIVHGFKQRKRQVIRRVLESQRVLKTGRHQVTGEMASPELQTRLLSKQYEKLSHPMVRFAQVLAEGDAQAVIDGNSVSPPVPILEAF